jgi:hypothetical protein
LGHILALVSLILCLVAVYGWARSRHRENIYTFVLGDHFYFCSATPSGVEIQWLSGVPPENRPAKGRMGRASQPARTQYYREARTDPSPGPFINVPEQSRRESTFAGFALANGQGQILQWTYIVYRASPLFPFHALAATWRALIGYPALAPFVWITNRAVRTAWRRHRSARRRARGLCPTCGYDLRASGERCPECGAILSGTGS